METLTFVISSILAYGMMGLFVGSMILFMVNAILLVVTDGEVEIDPFEIIIDIVEKKKEKES